MLSVSTAKVQLLQDLTGAKWDKKLHTSVDQAFVLLGVSVSNFSSTTNITDTVISSVIILP